MYHFTEADLNSKSLADLKIAYTQIGCTEVITDKRSKTNWLRAILTHQSAQVEKVAVAEVTLEEQVAPQTEEITTVEITFYDHEVHAGGKQIASITHDPDDFQTQRWVVKVGEVEIHRADAWAKCYEYVRWHYKQGTLPLPLPSSNLNLKTEGEAQATEVIELDDYRLVYVGGACPRNYCVYKVYSLQSLFLILSRVKSSTIFIASTKELNFWLQKLGNSIADFTVPN